MADIQIPQRNPQYVGPVPPPTDLINGYLNRQQENGQRLISAVPNAADDLYKAYIQQQQAKVAAIRLIGPKMANQIYGTNVQPPSQPDQSQQPAQPSQDQSPQPQNFHPNDPYGTIQASVKMGHPDTLGLYSQPQSQQPSPQTPPAGNPMMGVHAQNIQAGQAEMARNAQMGEYGMDQNKAVMDRLSGEKSLMEGEQFNASQKRSADEYAQTKAIQQKQFAENKAIQEDEFNRNKTLEVGTKQSEQQLKYSTENEKFTRAANAIKELNTAWNKVPSLMKGPGMGYLPSKAGKTSGKLASAAVDFNEKRKLASNELATAFLSESQRANPLESKKIEDALFSLQSTPEGQASSLNSVYSRIRNAAKQNENTHQTAAQAFGGKITSIPLPFLQTATGPNGHKIGSDDGKTWFDAQTGKPLQ